MARATSKGTCEYCKGVFGKSGMSRHLASCPQRPAGTGNAKPTRLYHLVVEGSENPQYWMHLEMPADSTLVKLDDYVRNVWLECCGHLSAFNIAGQSYATVTDPGWSDDLKMAGVKLSRVAGPGSSFTYEYDFGSTTELNLRVVDERAAAPANKGIELLAVNEQPDIRCEVCVKPATEVYSECIYEGKGWLCDVHAESHECGEEMLLPVVNSPRVGICAYQG